MLERVDAAFRKWILGLEDAAFRKWMLECEDAVFRKWYWKEYVPTKAINMYFYSSHLLVALGIYVKYGIYRRSTHYSDNSSDYILFGIVLHDVFKRRSTSYPTITAPWKLWSACFVSCRATISRLFQREELLGEKRPEAETVNPPSGIVLPRT